MSQWKEELPPDCPPQEASAPTGVSYFRLVRGNSPEDVDFIPVLRLNPQKGGDPCIANAISLFETVDACKRAAKCPTLRGMRAITKVTPPPTSGSIMQTGKYHHSWWITRCCDPIACCSDLIAI